MKIVFHGGNAANFREGFEDILGEDHEIITLPDRIASTRHPQLVRMQLIPPACPRVQCFAMLSGMSMPSPNM